MCFDYPIRERADYKSITVLTRCCGPTVIMAPTYRALIEEVRLFFAESFNVRAQEAPTPNKSEYFKREGASIAILRQVAESG